MKLNTLSIAILLAGLLGVTASSQAAVIFDNGTHNGLNGNEATGWVQADNFSLGTASAVASAGIYIGGLGNISAWDGTVEYYIFADVAGGPDSSPLASGLGGNINVTDTGVLFAGGGFGDVYKVVFDLASDFAAAASTTYWFGIHLSSNFNRDDIYWATANPIPGNGQQSEGGTFLNWEVASGDQDHAFYLDSERQPSTQPNPTPEPGTLALLGIGLLGAAGLRRRNYA